MTSIQNVLPVIFLNGGELPLRPLAAFDVVIMGETNLFQFNLQDIEDGELYIGEKERICQDFAHAICARRARSYSIEKGGVISLDRAVRTDALFSKTAVQLHEKCLDLCTAQVSNLQHALEAELPILDVSFDEERCHNRHRLCKYVIRTP